MQERAARQVDHGLHQSLVQRNRDRREPANPGLVAQRLGKARSQQDAHVFHRVVGIDLQVAGGVHPQLEAAVAAELAQHVVEERQSGGCGALATAVDVDGDVDACLGGAPRGRGGSR